MQPSQHDSRGAMNAMTLWTAYALAVLIGALSGIHIPLNGALGQSIGSPLVATIVLYLIALTLCFGVAWVVPDSGRAFLALGAAPKSYLLAGVFDAVIVVGSTALIARLGAAQMLVVLLSAQFAVRIAVTHWGWFGLPQHPVNATQALGGLLLVLGAVLVVRY